MAVQYRLYQNNDSRSNQYKKWYARAVMIDTVDTNKLAEQIEANCTVKRADVLAVISELIGKLYVSREIEIAHKNIYGIRFGQDTRDNVGE